MNTRTGFVFFCFTFSALAYAQDTTHLQAQTTLFGKPLSVTQNTDASASKLGVQTSTLLQFLGKNVNLMQASVEVSSSAQGTTNWYIAGKRVWSGNLALQNGSLVYSGGLAPVQLPLPLFVYPLGPVILEVDTGIDFQGSLDVNLTPTLALPLQDSKLQGTLQETISAGGYLEGYAKLLVVRAGIGGKINLIDGNVGANADLFLNQSPPVLTGLGKVSFLEGSIYGFVDVIKLLGQWRRLLSANLYSWNGKCYAFGAESCAL